MLPVYVLAFLFDKSLLFTDMVDYTGKQHPMALKIAKIINHPGKMQRSYLKLSCCLPHYAGQAASNVSLLK